MDFNSLYWWGVHTVANFSFESILQSVSDLGLALTVTIFLIWNQQKEKERTYTYVTNLLNKQQAEALQREEKLQETIDRMAKFQQETLVHIVTESKAVLQITNEILHQLHSHNLGTTDHADK